MRRSRTKVTKVKKNRGGLNLRMLIWLIPVITMIGALFFMLYLKPVDLGANNCLADNAINTHTMVLIDQTDPWTPSQIQKLKNNMNDLEGKLEPFDKLSLLSIDSEFGLGIQTLFSKCKIGFVSIWTQSPKKVEQTAKETFVDPLHKVINTIPTNSEPQDYSPILETITGLTRMNNFWDQSNNKRLIIFSDMMQNSRHRCINHYKQSDKEFTLVQNKSCFTSFNNNLDDLEVIVYYVKNEVRTTSGKKTSLYQDADHIEFWHDYFGAMGAQVSLLEF